MGKTQSKRSVDITTETKKGAEDEITEKMEKIEDLDKKEVINGDATMQENNESEKKDTEDVENDKDMTTEKNVDAQASGDSAEQNQSPTDDSAKEDGTATAEEISPLADESIKKSKKEKVKKKWSFRSISFGKKDKQKPAKNEDSAEDSAAAAATNGAADEKTSPETEESQKGEPSVNAADEKSTENHGENGNATEEELKEQTEENKSQEKLNDVTSNTTIITTTTETSAPVQNDTAAVSNEKTEKTAAAVAAVAIGSETKVAENAIIDEEASKNGNGITEEVNATESQKQTTDATESVEAPAENKNISVEVTTESSALTTNGDVNTVHLNGTNAESEQEVEQTKAQIEVNSNTDNKASAATLDYIPSTSINPPNVHVHAQDLNESSEISDNIQIDDIVDGKQQNIKKSTDVGVEKSVLLDSSPTSTESADIDDNDDDNKDRNVEIVVLSSESAPDTEKSSDEKISDDPSPPPLPISPPPSQVSVFAFTNNEESVEESIQIEKSETEPSSIINIDTEKEIESSEEIEPTLPNATEISNKIIDDETINNPLISNETNIEEVVVVVENKIENNFSDITEPTAADVHVDSNECEEMPMNKGHEEISTKVDNFPEKLHEDESSLAAAAAVVDEITEKAVEIVNQQLERSEEQNCTELLVHKDEEEEHFKEGDENIATEFANKVQIEIRDDEQEEVVQSSTTVNDTEASLCEQDKCSQESHSVMQITNTTDKDCIAALSSASETVQQPEDDDYDDDDVEMISSNKSYNLDAIVDEHFNITKEFANAKDLKENVAAAEITQELSVTSE